MSINFMSVLEFFARMFDAVQSIVYVQLICILLLSLVLFGIVLLNKTKHFNLSENSVKSLTAVVASLVFPAMFVGAVIILFDFVVFPFLFNFFWVLAVA